MANRSYLYSTNVVPPAAKEERNIVGISEWNYDIPLAYKLLLTGNPRRCKSLIWDTPEEIALVGDYNSGVERLTNFLQQIELPEAQPLIREAMEFLAKPDNRKTYFFLECGEIFTLQAEPLEAQAEDLLTEIRDIEGEAQRSLKALHKASQPSGFIGKLFGGKTSKPRNVLDPIYKLGLGNWSNHLYFELGKG